MKIESHEILKPYKRVSSAPKSIPVKKPATKFYVGCDKWWLRGFGRLHLDHLLPYKTTKPLDFPRGFYGIESCGHYCFLSSEVYVFQNRIEFLVQTNPSMYSNYTFMSDLLSVILGVHYETARTVRLHLFIDIAHSVEELNEGLVVARRRVSSKYSVESYEKFKSGHLTEISFTKGIGGKKNQFKLYPSDAKHGLKPPMSRLERQMERASTCLIRRPADFKNLIDLKPFKDITIYSVLKATKLKGHDLERFKLLRCLAKSRGLQEALGELRRDDRKHFKRNYKAVLAQLSKKKVNLQASFKNKLVAFIKRPMDSTEKELLELLTTTTHKTI